MAQNLKPLSQKQFLVTIDGQQAFFTKASAPKMTKDQSDYNDGQTGQTRTQLGFVKYEPVTLSKPYDAAQDASLEDWCVATLDTGDTFSVSIQPVNADLEGTPIEGSRTLVMADCQLASFEPPTVDRDSTGGAMLTLEVLQGAEGY